MEASKISITIDAREACKQIRAGKAQWTYGFVTELLRKCSNVHILTDRPIPEEWKAFHPRVKIIEAHGFFWHKKAVIFLKRESGKTIYISPTSYIVPALLKGKIPCVPIVHDLIAFRSEPHQWRATVIEKLTLGRAVKNAAHVFTISDATRRDLLERYSTLPSGKVTSIYAGPMKESVEMNEPDHKTILCIATLSPRKNQARLIRAYELLPSSVRDQYSLLLVGSRGWQDEEIVRMARTVPGVAWKDYVSNAEYESLLQSCEILALPSLYEGFGMQILDAMQRGIPVLTSNKGSLKEVVGDAAFTVDPESVESIAAGLSALLTNKKLCAELRKKGPDQAKKYSWRRTADVALNALNTLMEA